MRGPTGKHRSESRNRLRVARFIRRLAVVRQGQQRDDLNTSRGCSPGEGRQAKRHQAQGRPQARAGRKYLRLGGYAASMTRRARKYLRLAAPLAALCVMRLLHSPAPSAPALPSSGVQVVGPSAMLTMQRQGRIIFDARPSGRAIPGASRSFPARIYSAPLIVSRSQDEAQRWAARRGWSGLVSWVPAALLETRAQAGVLQMSPREAWRKARRGQVAIIDVSEPGEWSVGHASGSRRVDWRRIIAGDRSWVPKGRALVFT